MGDEVVKTSIESFWIDKVGGNAYLPVLERLRIDKRLYEDKDRSKFNRYLFDEMNVFRRSFALSN